MVKAGKSMFFNGTQVVFVSHGESFHLEIASFVKKLAKDTKMQKEAIFPSLVQQSVSII